MADQDSRSAAKLATLVAVPVALLAGVLAFVLLGSALGVGEPGPAPTGTPGPTGTPAAGETGPVALEQRELTERQATVCRALLSQLPERLRDLPQRPVTAGAEQNAAFGDPPITVECGLPEAQYPPTDQLWPLDGAVCWHAEERPEASRWVTVDREVPVRVTVPDAYDGPGQWVAEFNSTIVSTVLSSDEPPPPGCR